MTSAPDVGIAPDTELRSDRFVLRAWRHEDVDDVTRACQDAAIERWTPVPSPYARVDAEWFVDACAASWASGQASFAVTHAVTGRLLGSIGYVAPPHERVVEVGFWVAPWARGGGVASGATALLCDWSFDVRNVARVEWMAYTGNTGSRKVAERCGFRFEGTLRARADHRGNREDLWIAGLLATDPRPWHAT